MYHWTTLTGKPEYDSEAKVGIISDAASQNSSYKCDGRDVTLPREVFQAIINAAGGCIVLDAADLLNADRAAEEVVEVISYTYPEVKLVFRVTERR